jgi:hypothetical protein
MSEIYVAGRISGAYHCPRCVAAPLYHSRVRVWERPLALLSPFRPFRCHRCAWRGWKIDVKWRRRLHLKPPS